MQQFSMVSPSALTLVLLMGFNVFMTMAVAPWYWAALCLVGTVYFVFRSF